MERTLHNEDFIGVWQLYGSNLAISQLILQLNGTYLHTFMFGSQSHWGTWELADAGGFTVLRLTLRGAQPMVDPGSTGLGPTQWPAVEQWFVLQIYPNQIMFTDSTMMLRQIVAQPGMPPPMGQPAGMPGQAPGIGMPPPPSLLASSSPVPPIDVSSLAKYSAPVAQAPPEAPPGAQSSSLLDQWKAQSAAVIQAQQRAAQAMLAANKKTFDTINAGWQAQNAANLAATRAHNAAVSAAGHASAQNFIHSID